VNDGNNLKGGIFMFSGWLIGWFVLVFVAYGLCILNGIDPMFYLWLVFVLIGGIFLWMDGFDFYTGAPSKNGPVQVSIEHGEQGVKNRLKESSKGSTFSDFLAYMMIPLVICLALEYLVF